MATGIQGVVGQYVSGSQYLPSGRIRESWDEEIHKLNMQQNPLLMLLSKLGKEEVDQHTFNWMTKERKPDWVRLTAVGGSWASGAASSGTITVGAADKFLFAAGDLIQVPSISSSVMLYVSACDQSTGVITAQTVEGTINLSSLPSVKPLLFLVSNAFEKGTGKGTIKSQQPSAAYNYIQIIQTAIGIEESDKVAGYRGPNEWDEQLAEAGIDHAFKIEKMLFFGVRYRQAAGLMNGRFEQFFAGGINDFLSTHVVDASGALTQAEFSDWVDATIRYAENPVIFASDLIYGGLSKWQAQYLQVDAKSKELGIAVNTYVTNKGRKVAVIPHSELLCDDHAGVAFCADLADLKYVRFKGFDTHLERDIQLPDAKTKEDEYRTYCSLKLRNEKRHGKLFGVTSITVA